MGTHLLPTQLLLQGQEGQVQDAQLPDEVLEPGEAKVYQEASRASRREKLSCLPHREGASATEREH